MYLPALSIVAVVSLLLVTIGISTYNNMNRDKMRAIQSVQQQGISRLTYIEAIWENETEFNGCQEKTAENIMAVMSGEKDVSYIYITTSSCVLCAYPKSIDKEKFSDLFPISHDSPDFQKRTVFLSDGSEIYEIAKPLSGRMHINYNNGSRMVSEHASRNPDHPEMFIVIGMKMDAYEMARQSDAHHAMLMMTILVVLGVGAFFFLFVIQNYYLVDKTLKKTEDYTRHVLDNMANGLLSIDTSDRIVTYNQLALDYLGVDQSDINEFDLEKIIDFKHWDVWNTLKRSGAIRDREILYKPENGPPLPLALSITPILDKNRVCSGAVIVIHDLREVKALQHRIKQTEKMAAVGEMAAGIAHEIRNPLSSIRGFAKFLHHALKDKPDEQEYATVIVNEMDRINKVITDLLNFARPLSPTLTLTNIQKLFDHIVRLVKEDTDLRKISLIVNVPEDMPDILLDSDLMTQAILNLTLNALDAVQQQGQVEIGTAIHRNKKEVTLWVEDEGIGIQKDHLEKIFEPYFTRRDKGTGLGLPIVKRIVENLNGSIDVFSPPPGKSKGCRFVIHIPFSGDVNHA